MTLATRERRSISRRTWAFVALAVTAVALFSVLVPLHAVLYGTLLPLAMILGAGVCAAPLIALAYPRVSILVFCTAAFALPLVVSADRDPTSPWPWSVPALIAFAVFVLVITVVRGWRAGLITWGVSNLAALVAPLLLMTDDAGDAAAADLIVTASITAAAFLVGVLLAGRIRVGEELTKSRELTALEQDRRVLVEERTRIARELHDVVAHSMSLIQVQSSTARYRIPDLPGEAVAEFDDIARVARESLTEMRRLLGVLRTEEQAPQLAPQQGIADIPTLVDSTRRAGVTVGLALAMPPVELPPSVQIAAFRIVQEALSNAVRHAPGSAIEVDIRSEGEAVAIRVRNDGADAAAASVPAGSGHGLRGMRERVALLGGDLEVGPDPAGGWIVSAVLPWTERGERP